MRNYSHLPSRKSENSINDDSQGRRWRGHFFLQLHERTVGGLVGLGPVLSSLVHLFDINEGFVICFWCRPSFLGPSPTSTCSSFHQCVLILALLMSVLSMGKAISRAQFNASSQLSQRNPTVKSDQEVKRPCQDAHTVW